jgi:diguanylate cyclase (GGDEF)-like protein
MKQELWITWLSFRLEFASEWLSFQLESTRIVHSVTASIGVVVFLGTEVPLDELIKRADGAMYRAKEAGRNFIRFHDAVN